MSSVLALGLLGPALSSPPSLQAPTGFASRIAALSEREGSFDSDNLMSNEKSYLHVIPALRERGVTGGAYLGVGPDQNFSYIAQVRPAIAFLVDIRRDNLLLHLLFKALFWMSGTRAEYVSLLFGRTAPEDLDAWREADLGRLVAYIESAAPSEPATARLRARVDATIRSFGVPLSETDFATLDRFHRSFISEGLSLTFSIAGSTPRGYYPTYRELLLETDRQGGSWNFLASEDDFQFVRSLERRDLVVPVVGDLGGPVALNAIGRLLAARDEPVSAFYVSNVEYYLAGEGRLQSFLDNLARLPHTERSVLIRSVFGGYVLPQSAPGYFSTSLVQPIDELLEGFSSGRYRRYDDLLLSGR